MRFFVYLIVFFSFFDLFSQLPIMSPFALSLGASSFLTGLAVGIYSFSNTIGNVISGFMTDRKGPFLVLLTGLFASSVSLYLYMFVVGPYSLLGIRFLHGFMEGLIVPAAFTFLANRAKESKRGRSVAISGVFVGMAAIIGPAYSGIVASKTSAASIMVINGVIMLILAILAIFFLRNFSFERKGKSTTGQHFKVRELFRHPGMQRAFAGAFFLMFSQGVLALILPLKVEALGFDTKMTGMLLSTFGVVAILIFLLPINRIFDRVRPMVTLSFGISIMGVSMLFLSQMDDLVYLFGALAIYGIGFAFLFPSINSLLIDSSSPEYRGKAYGYFYAFFSIGVVAGSSVIGYLDLTYNGGFMVTGFVLIGIALYTILGMRKKKRYA
ncbi:MFS transporter [Sporosarcina sp. NCCP-2222]|uniref:MFS transporter n=1 Tax=Sporosarcina sp. NCCP-2222 TaxID=2935073 RepID=UPI002089063E|nr:MFS transporter [Sporosarcina sp. NCCP-2222]GKV54529.1 MFS transporter [Sporosarcina sp. NCCP-2222]